MTIAVPPKLLGLAVAVVAAAGVLLGGSAGSAGATTSTSTSPAPVPVVHGNLLLDARTGATWTPHAVNWPSFEYACQQGWGESAAGATAAAAQAMASWGITAVRIPLNEACWLHLDGSPAYGTAASYQAALKSWVDVLNAAGLVAILDLHWTAPPGYAADGQRAMTDARSVTFWQQVAAAYRTTPSVMFDLFNEPYSRDSFTLTWDCWQNGGCAMPSSKDTDPTGTATFTVHGMAELVGAVRTAGATQPILLGGLDYSSDLRGWLAHRPADDQLVASWHNYPGQRCHTVTCWTNEVLPVAAQVPVMATEFGETDGGSGFLTSFMTWADTHGIGYSPWAWWVVDPDEGVEVNRYALISNLTTFTPKAPSGTAYHDHLAGLGLAVDRIGGTDRYDAAIRIAQAAYPSGADTVYVTTGLNFPDALSAGAAAAAHHAPLLLTDPTALRSDVAAEITALHPDRIVVAGGTASVSDGVLAALAAIQQTERLAGPDRYAASRAIVASEFPDGAPVLYVATGASFPDALSAAAAGGGTGAVLLVPGTAPDGLDAATIATVTALHPDRIVIAGGTASVNTAVEDDLALLAPTTRAQGADRYAASVSIGLGAYPSAARVFLATGSNFPDALGGSAWAGALSAPLFVVPSSCVPTATLAAIRTLGATRVTLLGGPASLDEHVAALAVC